MKVIGRTIAILAAALLIVGALVAISQASSAALGAGQSDVRTLPPSGQLADASGQPPAGAPAGGRQERDGGSLFGAVELVKNLGIIGAIVAVVALATRVVAWRRPQRPPASPSPSV